MRSAISRRPGRAKRKPGSVGKGIEGNPSGERNSIDRVDLVGWDDVADGSFDEIAEARGLLDARAGLGADMHQDLAGIDRRKKVLAKKRLQAERQDNADEEPGDERPRPAESQRQKRAVAGAKLLEAAFEALLKPFEGITRWRGGSGGVAIDPIDGLGWSDVIMDLSDRYSARALAARAAAQSFQATTHASYFSAVESFLASL